MKLHARLLLIVALLAAGSAHAACQLAKLPDIPVTMQGPRAIVPATVNGSDARFIVDSGAFFSSISRAAAARYGMKIGPSVAGLTVRGLGKREAPYGVATAKDFTFDSLTFHNIEFIVFEQSLADPGDGSIGQNILGAPDVEYDLGHGVIRLFRPTGCGDASLAYWVTTEPYSEVDIDSTSFAAPDIRAAASIDGSRIHVLLDSGSPRSLLSLGAAARAGVKPGGQGVVSAGYTSGIALRSYFQTWLGSFASFKFGDEEVRNTPLRFGDMGATDFDMLLGMDFFLSHHLFVANSQHRLYFTYNGGPVFNLDRGPQTDAAAPHPPPDAGAPSAAAEPDAPADAAGFGRLAAAAAAREDLPGAIADLTRAIALSPDDPSYVYDRGRAEIANHQPLLAMADLDQALKLKPDYIQALLVRAVVHFTAGQPAQARSDLAAADQAADKDPDKRLAVGEAYGTLRLFREALPDLDQWIASHPDDARRAEALNDRCWARAQLNVELDKALADCNEALRLRPGDPVMLDSRGLVRLRAGDFDKAIADYGDVLRLRPNTAWSLYGRGLAELRKGRASEGQADIQAATALDPKLQDKAKAVGLTP